MTARKIIFTVAVLLIGRISADGQNVGLYSFGDGDVVLHDVLTSLVKGQESIPSRYAKVTEGTPYLRDEWSDGSLLFAGGKVIDHIELRLDLFGKELHYKNSDSQDMIAITPIRAVMLAGPTGRLIFIPGTPWRDVDRALDGAWLQVLVNDTVSLLHEIRKTIIERTPIGGSTVSIIDDFHIYYVQMNGKLIRIRSWSELPALFGDKKEALTRFIRDNHLKGHTSDEYAQVVVYYNTLIK